MKPLSTLCWIVLCGVVAWPALSLCADMSDSNPAPKAGAQSPSNAGQARAVTGTDLTFLNEAAPGGRAEVELGSVALKQASSPEVKTFAQHMIDDHSKANHELDELATKKKVVLNKEQATEQKQAMDKLSKLRGGAFDREYAKDMLEDHEKDVAKFQQVATNATDADVKAYAAKTPPTLRQHLEMAQARASSGSHDEALAGWGSSRSAV